MTDHNMGMLLVRGGEGRSGWLGGMCVGHNIHAMGALLRELR